MQAQEQVLWGVSTMAWGLLLLTLLTQGAGEVSGEGTMGTPGLTLCLLLLRPAWALLCLTSVSFPLRRALGTVCPHSASLSLWLSWRDGHHLLSRNQQ